MELFKKPKNVPDSGKEARNELPDFENDFGKTFINEVEKLPKMELKNNDTTQHCDVPKTCCCDEAADRIEELETTLSMLEDRMVDLEHLHIKEFEKERIKEIFEQNPKLVSEVLKEKEESEITEKDNT